MNAELSSTQYTPDAQSCLANAGQEAEKLRHAQVLPEHILLALLTPESGAAWGVLSGAIRNPLILKEGLHLALADAAPASGGSPSYSFRSQRVLSEAKDEARRAGHQQIDTGHVLLGLLDEGGAAGQLLRRNRVEAATLRHWLRHPPAPLATTAKPAVAPFAPRPVVSDERFMQLERLPLKQALPRLLSWPAIVFMLGLLLASGAAGAATNQVVAQAGLVIFIIDGWIISLCAHEFSHALLADLGGDHSVRSNGYLSFNPLKYTHPVLSIVIPVFFMMLGGIGLPGGAVYIQTARLRGPKWESAVAFAGPAASALMAVVFALPFVLGIFDWGRYFSNPMLWQGLAVVTLLNCASVVLNLVPVPPLDGFGIFAPLLSPNVRAAIYTFSMFGVFLVFMLLITNPSIQQAYHTIIDSMMSTLKVDPGLASWGLYNFAFWRS